MSPAKFAVRPVPRGQALLLSALGMVLLVLMVCMTLSFGTKAKAKMEVQIVADQAAYSTAVASARTFNVLSMTNRVMIAHQTAMLGIQSAISFATIWFVIVQTMFVYYTAEIANQMTCCNWPCAFLGCVAAAIIMGTRWIRTAIELARLVGQFPNLDRAAGQEAKNTAMANNFLWGGQLLTISWTLYRAINNQTTTRKAMVRASGGGGDWQVANGGDKVALREAGFDFGAPVALLFQGAIQQSNLILFDRHAVYASMGSRGHLFTSDRSRWNFLNGVNSMLTAAFRRIGAGSDIRPPGYQHLGHGQFGTFPHDDVSMFGTTTSKFAMADDHGMGIIRYSGFAARRPLTWPLVTIDWVMSNDALGFHMALSTPGIWADAPAMHTVPAICFMNCPSAWTNFADFNPILVGDPRDNFMQPKFPVTVYKDASLSKPDPFNLFFNYRFSSGATFDMKHGVGANGGALTVRDGMGTADISRQMGYSTGLAYYHRRNHWAEPPNLFNGFWRAGITRPDVDRRATSYSVLGIGLTPDNSHDIEDTLDSSGAPWAASAYRQLYAVGYQGIRP